MIRQKLTFLLLTASSWGFIFAQPFTGHGVSGLRAVYNSYHLEADFNNDGYMDILAAGNDGTMDYTEIYLNNKDLTFTILPTSIPLLSNVSADAADFNGDGNIDIAISGINAGQKYCRIYKNNGDNTFTIVDSPIEDVAYGSVLWSDFNNDGYLDLFTCGINQSGNYISRIYKGGSSSFTLMNTGIVPVTGGCAVILDYNNDHYTDIALSGYTSSGQIMSYLFRNKGNFSFESVNSGFERVTNGNIAVADINGDGFSEVILTGMNHLGKKVSQLYENNSGVFMRSATADLDSLSSSKIKTGDFNNDGFPDLILTGTDSQGFYQTILCTNNHDFTFSKDYSTFIPLTMANAAMADFDRDNDLDIILSGKGYTGNFVNFYVNGITSGNVAPSEPVNLHAAALHDSVTLSWDRASDTETPAAGLTYNIYLGTSSGGYNIVSPSSFINGTRKLMKAGNSHHSNSVTLKGLPEGHYFWSVQSIDNNNTGSSFASEGSFTICHNLKVRQDTSVCRNDKVRLKAGAASDIVNWYSENTGLLASNIKEIEFLVNSDDNIIVELTNSLGCTLHDTIELKALPLPEVNLGNDISACYQSTVSLDAGTGWKAVSWFNGSNQLIASAINKYEYTVDADETIMVAVTNNDKCKNRDTIQITKLDLPVISIGDDQFICRNDSARVSLNASFPEMKWYNSNHELLGSRISYHYKVSETGTILASVRDEHGCLNNDTVIVTMYPLPDIRLPKDTSICYGEEVTVTANRKFSQMKWISANIEVPVTDTTRIRFKVKLTDEVRIHVEDEHGCQNSDTIVITRLNLPVFNIGRDTASCTRSPILLNAGAGWKRVDWYKTGNILLSPDNWFYRHNLEESTNIWARVVNSNNCVNYDTVALTAFPLPVFNLGNDTALCVQKSLMLHTGNNYIKTVWRTTSEGIILDGPNELEYKPDQDNQVIATATDNHYCSNSDTIQVSLFKAPVIDLGSDTTICYDSELVLNAGDQWKNTVWSDLTTGDVYTSASDYKKVIHENDSLVLKVTDINGCITSDTLLISVASLPVFRSGKDTSICAGKSLTFSIDQYQIKWYSARKGLLSNANTLPDFTPEQADTLIAVATTRENCVNSDTIIITVYDLPRVNAGQDTILCYGSEIRMGSENTAQGNGPFIYEWTPGAVLTGNTSSNPIFPATEDHKLLLKVTDRFGCVNYDSIWIDVNPETKFHLGDIKICKGQTVSLGQSPVATGSRFPYKYVWSPDSALSSYDMENPVASPKATKRFRLIASSWKCPADTAYVTVTVRDLPVPYVSPTLTIGNKGNVQLYAEGGTKYRWYPSESLNNAAIADPIATPLESTLYTVEVIDTFGCSSEATVQVNVRNEVFVPQIFTPNGDGTNDIFRIYGFGFAELELIIFDRFNSKVFESIDLDEILTHGWDGTCKGKDLETGNYRWILKGRFADGKAVLVNGKNTGVVTLVR